LKLDITVIGQYESWEWLAIVGFSIAIQIDVRISSIRFNICAKIVIPSLTSDGITILA
jgi:hypothetical protein